MNTIDTQDLEKTFVSCLYQENELAYLPKGDKPKDAVLVDGIRSNYGFHPQRLEQARTKVKGWLGLLPTEFHKDTGGGWSFLNACMTKDGHQWGEQPSVELLMVLGVGLKLAEYQLPKDLWKIMPGGVPYFCVL